MAIKRIKVSNFKSFKEIDVKLNKFNILIGSNASGKSNFIHIFEFLKSIHDFGLEDAISLQGGVEYLRNINIGNTQNLSFKIYYDHDIIKRIDTKKGFGIKTTELCYEFSLKFFSKKSDFEIVTDRISLNKPFFRLDEKKDIINEEEELGSAEFVLSSVDRKIELNFNNPLNMPIEFNDIFPPFLSNKELPYNPLILESPLFSFLVPDFDNIIGNISIYDFDSKLPKKATPITGKAQLEEDGNNLSIVLKNILTDNNKKRKFTNLIKDLLPFIDDLDVEKFTDKSLFFKLREIYTKNQYLPASLLSDGTINITLLIIALYFEQKPLTIIEEPERNLHPGLISKVVKMMEDASRNKQIIVTTHNPEMIKHVNKENILLVSRDKEGFSQISRPAEKEEVKVFLENDMGIDELFVQNLLEM